MTNNMKHFITHGGVFHADEAFGTAILKILFPTYTLRRVFKVTPEMCTENAIIYDIGGGELDHHTAQNKADNGFHPETEVPYAACGLIWKKYGIQVLNKLGVRANAEDVWAGVERTLIIGIDGIDNGLELYGQAMSVSQAVKAFNPTWDEETSADHAFNMAVDFASTILKNEIRTQNARAKARQLVREAMENKQDRVVVLDRYLPWQETVVTDEDILYVIYPSARGGWNVQAVPAELGSFATRKPFPQEWWGKSADELARVTGTSLNFCHPNGFLTAVDSLDDAMKVANIAVQA